MRCIAWWFRPFVVMQSGRSLYGSALRFAVRPKGTHGGVRGRRLIIAFYSIVIVLLHRQALLLSAGDLLDTLVGCGQMFGHGAAKLGDGLTNILPYTVMRGVGVLFALHILQWNIYL